MAPFELIDRLFNWSLYNQKISISSAQKNAFSENSSEISDLTYPSLTPALH